MQLETSTRPIQYFADNQPIEMVERKGKGHPDSVCDSICENAAKALINRYESEAGRILHFNLDKALLRGGVAAPAFGGGRIIEPIDIYFAGRASDTFAGKKLQTHDIILESAKNWIKENFRELDVDQHVRLHSLARPGSVDLTHLFHQASRGDVPRANDTSFGCGFFPMTALEKATIWLSRKLDAHEFITPRPEIGEDTKVMGVRNGRRFSFTISVAFIDRYVTSINDYLEKKSNLASELQASVSSQFDIEAVVALNTADNAADKDVFLTVTGTSAECGDDGQVGRGNRANGIITPYRPMTMEAIAGKNPVSHVGRLYNIWANDIAKSICLEFPDIQSAECFLVSQIGSPINEPQLIDLRVFTAHEAFLHAHTKRRIDEHVKQKLQEFCTGNGQTWN